jgi:ribosome-associated translation inhibitor RaiA
MIRGDDMKLTETRIKQIIKEELEKLEDPDALFTRAQAALSRLSPEEQADIKAYFSEKAKESK